MSPRTVPSENGGHGLPNRKGLAIVIALTRLNGHPVMVNSDLIEQIEETPDTVVTLTSGNKLIVLDRMVEVQAKIIDFKRKIYGPPA